MDIIEAYKAKDGTIFDNKKECMMHEYIVEKETVIRQVVERFYYYGIAEKGIVQGIIENLHILKEI